MQQGRIEYNSIADALSRLCPIDEVDTTVTSQNDIVERIHTMWEVPEKEHAIICKVHNTYSGHFGVEETLRRLRAQGQEWEYMRAHVKAFVQSCPLC